MCSLEVVQLVVYATTIACAIAGLGLISEGCVALADVNKFNTYGIYLGNLLVSPILIIILGVVLTSIACLGFIGARSLKTVLLCSYTITLLVLFSIQMILTIYALFRTKVGTKNDNFIFQIIRQGINDLIKQYDNFPKLKVKASETLDLLQIQLKCCGNTGPSDYVTSFPWSCCKLINMRYKHCVNNRQYNKKGCTQALLNTMLRHLTGVALASLAAGTIEVVSAGFAIYLMRKIENRESVNNFYE